MNIKHLDLFVQLYNILLSLSIIVHYYNKRCFMRLLQEWSLIKQVLPDIVVWRKHFKIASLNYYFIITLITLILKTSLNQWCVVSVHCTETYIAIWNGFGSPDTKPDDRVCGQLNFFDRNVKEFKSATFRVVVRYSQECCQLLSLMCVYTYSD